MTCETLALYFSAYLDSELSPSNSQELERHEKECERCAAFLESMRQTVSFCKEMKIGESPGPLPADARDELRQLYRRHLGGAGAG